MTQASTAERWRLRHSGRVPLRIAQRARETLETLDEDEALTGLYLPELATDATRRMAIGLLRQVPGWPEDVWVQLRREGLSATVLGQVGNAGAATTRTVVQSATGFRAYDGQGAPLGAMWAQRETLGDADYRNQMEQIQDEQKKAELTEFERLTKEALKFDEQVACELPPAG